ncbi:MAG: hypothetical protein NTY59_16670 [Alphaproteobacteria bacterium]|nr:hypothetical protein [Alphaproteobacteria bacterium]
MERTEARRRMRRRNIAVGLALAAAAAFIFASALVRTFQTKDNPPAQSGVPAVHA